jgi:hypothetical protein
MAKHRRFSDSPKPDSIQEDQEIELAEQEVPSKETSTNIKSILLSGTKYVYIVAVVALLSGIFTPLTIGTEIELVAMGMVSVFLGLGGGIAIFLGVKNQKFTTLMICVGLGMMIVSLIFIYELADRSLFG